MQGGPQTLGAAWIVIVLTLTADPRPGVQMRTSMLAAAPGGMGVYANGKGPVHDGGLLTASTANGILSVRVGAALSTRLASSLSPLLWSDQISTFVRAETLRVTPAT